MRIILLIATIVAATSFVKPAQAAITINIYETGGDVVFSYSGSLDITGLTDGGGNPNFQLTISGVAPNFMQIYIADPGFPDVDVYFPQMTGPLTIGDGSGTLADSVTGDRFAIETNIFRGEAGFSVPKGYVSGAHL